MALVRNKYLNQKVYNEHTFWFIFLPVSFSKNP